MWACAEDSLEFEFECLMMCGLCKDIQHYEQHHTLSCTLPPKVYTGMHEFTYTLITPNGVNVQRWFDV